MNVFVCDNSYDSIMTCIYDAWVLALKIGHENVKIERMDCVRQNLLDEYYGPVSDPEKSEKVTRSVQTKISYEALLWIYRAALSIDPSAPDAMYRFMILGFKVGSKVTTMLTHPAVMTLFEINRKVGNEAHHFLEFARFNCINGNVYVCHLEPINNVIFSVAEHFAERMPSEHFMIIDDNRRIAAVHPKDDELYVRELTDDEFCRLSTTEDYEDEYTSMWRTFFDAIAIKQRINPACQNNLFPKWKRKHATEFM